MKGVARDPQGPGPEKSAGARIGSGRVPVAGAGALPSALTRQIAVPAIILAAGEEAGRHFLNFFIATLRNRNTRRAYARQSGAFCAWCAARGVGDVRAIRTEHVAAYVEQLTRSPLETASVKQALAAIRMLFDWLVVRQVLPANPAASVRGPRLVAKEGRTPVLDGADVVQLLESMPTADLVGLRDRALIGVMAYTFARIGAALALDVGDYVAQGRTRWLRLREKGGQRRQIAVHHLLEEYLDTYLAAAASGKARGTPLFRTARGRSGTLSDARMSQSDAWRMLQRRARAAGIEARLSNHTWRATGITTFLEHGGALETAQYMAGHADPRTTQLYDRRRQLLSRSEVERIRYERRPR
jgi:site-specific recombinase XerD